MTSLNSIFKLPNRVVYTTGAADNGTPLTAFDKALNEAGINDTNLILVSSTVPPGAEESNTDLRKNRLELGSSVQVVLSRAESSVPGEKIVACVSGCRLRHQKRSHPYNAGHGFGINVEYHRRGTGEDLGVDEYFVKKYCEDMLAEMAERRGAQIRGGKVTHAYVEHTVKKHGCAIAALVYLSSD